MARQQAIRLEVTASRLKTALSAGDVTTARQLEATLREQARGVHSRTTGPAWWVASEIPYLGSPVKAARGMSSLTSELSTAVLPATVDAVGVVEPTGTGQVSDRINLDGLASVARPMAAAAATTLAIQQHASQLPGSTWLSAVNAKLALFRGDVATLQHATSDLAVAGRLLPAQLGADGTRRYFVAFETESEARGLGGLPGAYAILTARHGRLSFSRFGSDTDIGNAHAHVALGRSFDTAYDSTYAPKDLFVNSDASPNFPYSAKIWMSMWQDKFHQHLDGAIATDPTALSYLLRTAGAVTLTDGTTIDASNAVSFFEHDIYVKYPSALDPSINQARKQYQTEAARLVASQIVHQPMQQLAKALPDLREAVDEHRLLVYTRPGPAESYLSQRPSGGLLPRTTRPFVDVTVNNGSAKKVDYYLQRSVTYTRPSCAAGKATVAVVLTNTAPTSGLPAIVAGERAKPHTAGYARSDLLVTLYGTQGSTVTSTTIDGHTAYIGAGSELGHPLTLTDVSIPAGASRTVVFHLHEPAATGPVIMRSQPGVNPETLSVHAPTCGA